MSRHEVHGTEVFFAELDAQLPAERGSLGQPSATDFIVTDLPTVVEQFAVAFEGLPESIEGLPSIRMMIGTGALVRAFVVHGLLTDDGVVKLLGIDIDL